MAFKLMAMRRSFILFVLTISLLSSGFSVARAQVFGDNAAAGSTISFGDKNLQVKDLIKLQYQLQVLKSLIDHETAVSKIVDSSIGLGLMDPAIPVPDETLCKQVPANIPCAQAYNGLYEGYSVERKEAEVAVAAAPPAPSLVAGSDIPSVEAAALPGAADASLLGAGDTIFWTDITCLSGTCTAVITPNPGDPKARYRVSSGEKLPDGSVIKTISAAGVSITRHDKTVQLDPAPKA